MALMPNARMRLPKMRRVCQSAAGDCCATATSAGWRCWRECRGRGVGAALLALLVALARERGNDRAILNAQTHALPFYARFGFMPEGLEFTEAGIPHRTMTLTLR